MFGQRHFAPIFIGAAAATWFSPVAAASPSLRPYNLPSQPLELSLRAIARQTGGSILFAPQTVRGRRAPALRGRFDRQSAVLRLLDRTNLRAKVNADGSIIVVEAVKPVLPLPGPAAETPRKSRLAQERGERRSFRKVPRRPPSNSAGAEIFDDIVVVGTRLENGVEARPVRILSRSEIESTAAMSGDDLFRTIPQMGDVLFNASRNSTSSNATRGDVASVNLRNLGVGNTLVLLNGRRTVAHPASQADERLVPSLTFNANAIPVAGLERLELLLDGAAAVYGSDAVAGVVNAVLRDDVEGVTMQARYGFHEGSGLAEQHLDGAAGHNLGDRGNITVFASYDNRQALRADEQDYTASLDLRPLFQSTRFAGTPALDQRIDRTPWANLATASGIPVAQGDRYLTDLDGLFHVQPSSQPGCTVQIGAATCIDDGALATSGADRNLRFDFVRSVNSSVLPAVTRINLFVRANYLLGSSTEVFGEAGYYDAHSRSRQLSPDLIAPITIPSSNYYNPFGPVTFSDGRINPNRIGGTDVPEEGLAITLRSYNFSEFGPVRVDIFNDQYRLLAGTRWTGGGGDWEAAVLYSAARARDVSDGLSATLVQRQLALSTPDAYNPFAGGNLIDPSIASSNAANRAALESSRVKATRASDTSLAMADLHAKNREVVRLPGGPLGLAVGFEIRRETLRDDRDKRLDGTIAFRDSITGQENSDLVSASSSSDVAGSRTVGSAFAEVAVPIVSPDLEIPLVRRAQLQIAARYEHYSDVGGVMKPKIAGFWEIAPGMRLRGSYVQGFKAPNLEQVNAERIVRSSLVMDHASCAADLRAGRIAAYGECTRVAAANLVRSGNQDLKPETSTNWSAGAVIEPILPARLGAVTLSLDFWNIRQNGIVGVVGPNTSLVLDYLKRVQGSVNTDIIRDEPTQEDIAAFAGTGLAPAGRVQEVRSQFSNLLPQRASGLDLALNWRLRTNGAGSFKIDLNASYLHRFHLEPSATVRTLLAAREAGLIDQATLVIDSGNLIRRGGRPRWKAAATARWTLDGLEVGALAHYTSAVDESTLVDTAGMPFVVQDQLTADIYGQAEILRSEAGSMRFRVGVRNLTNERPPLSVTGFLHSLYIPFRRYWYLSVGASY